MTEPIAKIIIPKRPSASRAKTPSVAIAKPRRRARDESATAAVSLDVSKRLPPEPNRNAKQLPAPEDGINTGVSPVILNTDDEEEWDVLPRSGFAPSLDSKATQSKLATAQPANLAAQMQLTPPVTQKPHVLRNQQTDTARRVESTPLPMRILAEQAVEAKFELMGANSQPDGSGQPIDRASRQAENAAIVASKHKQQAHYLGEEDDLDTDRNAGLLSQDPVYREPGQDLPAAAQIDTPLHSAMPPSSGRKTSQIVQRKLARIVAKYLAAKQAIYNIPYRMIGATSLLTCGLTLAFIYYPQHRLKLGEEADAAPVAHATKLTASEAETKALGLQQATPNAGQTGMPMQQNAARPEQASATKTIVPVSVRPSDVPSDILSPEPMMKIIKNDASGAAVQAAAQPHDTAVPDTTRIAQLACLKTGTDDAELERAQFASAIWRNATRFAEAMAEPNYKHWIGTHNAMILFDKTAQPQISLPDGISLIGFDEQARPTQTPADISAVVWIAIATHDLPANADITRCQLTLAKE